VTVCFINNVIITFSAGKRLLPADSGTSENAAKAPKLDTNLIFSQLKGQETTLMEIKEVLDKVDSVENAPPDPRIEGLSKAMRLILKSHENLSSLLVDSAKVNQPSAPSAVKNSSAGKSSSQVAKTVIPPISPEESASRKIKLALKDSEKKTVIFNLNMGKAPAMNKDTLSRKVTEALSSAAKSGKHDYDINDAEDVIDSVLSCSKLEFLGKTTKLFLNKRNLADTRNTKMHTIRVRMDFRDRDTRTQAEIYLRKICKVSCSVPYPRKLRTMLDDLVKKGKAQYPDSFIRTRVNIDELTIEAHAKSGTGWVDLHLKQGIPLDILDNQVGNSTVDVEMVVTQPEGSQVS
jgi:hypothetical protein